MLQTDREIIPQEGTDGNPLISKIFEYLDAFVERAAPWLLVATAAYFLAHYIAFLIREGVL